MFPSEFTKIRGGYIIYIYWLILQETYGNFVCIWIKKQKTKKKQDELINLWNTVILSAYIFYYYYCYIPLKFW